MSDGLYLQIAGKLYRVERIPFAGDQRGWKLTPPTGNPYQVIRNGDALTCDCADAVFKKMPRGERCKHVKAMVDVFGEFL